MASPCRRWKNDCRTCQPTTARRCSTACSRTSQPLRTRERPRAGDVAERGVPAQPQRDAEHRQHDADGERPPRRQPRRDQHQPADGDQQPGRDRPGTIRRRRAAGGWRTQRAGVVDQPVRPATSASRRAGRAAAAARGGRRRPSPVTSALTRAARTQRMPSPSDTRAAADAVDLQLGVPAGDQPAHGDQRAAAADQPEAPVDDGRADHRAHGEQQQGDDDGEHGEPAVGQVGPVEGRPQTARQLVGEPEERARRRRAARRGSCRPAGRRAASGCRSGRSPPRPARRDLAVDGGSARDATRTGG